MTCVKLANIALDLGEPLSQEELNYLLKEFDADGRCVTNLLHDLLGRAMLTTLLVVTSIGLNSLHGGKTHFEPSDLRAGGFESHLNKVCRCRIFELSFHQTHSKVVELFFEMASPFMTVICIMLSLSNFSMTQAGVVKGSSCNDGTSPVEVLSPVLSRNCMRVNASIAVQQGRYVCVRNNTCFDIFSREKRDERNEAAAAAASQIASSPALESASPSSTSNKLTNALLVACCLVTLYSLYARQYAKPVESYQRFVHYPLEDDDDDNVALPLNPFLSMPNGLETEEETTQLVGTGE